MYDSQTLLHHFRQKLQGGVIGPFCKTRDPAMVEALGRGGFDFCILDMEHGPVTTDLLEHLIRACEVAGMLPVVRAPSLSEQSIAKPLDLGACGVQVPQINSAEEARRAVQIAKFYPLGNRGVCRFVRAAHYSAIERKDYFASANQCLLIAQLEGAEGLNQVDEILAVEGIDILFIGPYDLSQSLGVPGETTHPKVIGAMNSIVHAARAKGRAVGVFADSPETMRMWREAGVQYLSYSVDTGILYEASCHILKEYRAAIQ